MTDVQERRVPWPPPDPARRSGPESAPPEAPTNGWLRLAILLGVVAFVGIRWGWWPIAVILGFVLMLFVHELGHYVAARRAGMKVTEFFLGFGPRIASFRRGEVQYGLKAIPLGAYVRIIGMNNLEEVPPADEPRTYRSKGYWSRFCVAVAGVAMNFALALVLLFIAFVGFGVPDAERWSVNSVSEGSPAAAVGLQPGDRIVSADGQAVSTFGELTAIIRAKPGQEVRLVVDRNGEQLTKVATLATRNPSTSESVGFLGIGQTYGDEKVGALTGVQESFTEFGRITAGSVSGLAQIFSPSGVENYANLLTGNDDADPNQRLLSPVGAVKIGTEAAETGFGRLVLLMAAINIFVGLMNLIPLLPFDGGHIAIATYEAVRSRPGKPYRADITKLLPFSYAILAIFLVLFVGNLYLDLQL
jgi:membrane-associated protease RseP (regulator of RpoE activity)